MEIQSTVSFLVGSILTCFGLLAFVVTIVIVNNIFAKYWKPIKWQIFQHHDIHVIDRATIGEFKQSSNLQKEERKTNAKR